MVDAVPNADPGSPFFQYASDIANDLSAVLYTNWLIEDYLKQTKLMLWDTFIYGVGLLKAVWDNDRDGGLGNAMICRVDPWAFYVDPEATSLDDMEYCVEVRRMSLDAFERRYPNARMVQEATGTATIAYDQKPRLFSDQGGQQYANAGQIPGSGTFGSLGSDVVGYFGRPTSPKDVSSKRGSVVVYEFWLRENETWVDDYRDIPKDDRPSEETHAVSRWRVMVMAQGEIVLDEYADDLWSYGSHPYERYCFDDIGEFYGISLVDHLSYPQIYINRLLTMMQFNAELVGNPVFLEPTNAGTNRIPMINKPGLRLPVTGAAAMTAGGGPRWLEPPNMPDFVMSLIEFWIQRIENTSGLSALQKGKAPNQRNAQGVINQVQEAAFVRIRSALQNYEKTIEQITFKLADLVIDNYNEPRIVAIVGQEGENTSKVLFSNHFSVPGREGMQPLKFTVQIRAGASTPTSRQGRQDEADKMYAMGAIDDLALLQAHQYPHAQEIIERKEKKMQQGLFNPPGARQRAQRQQ
jgi:hypothetical protein